MNSLGDELIEVENYILMLYYTVEKSNDNLNLVCDSYEPNVRIRELDKYCIDEITLKNKVIKLYKQMLK